MDDGGWMDDGLDPGSIVHRYTEAEYMRIREYQQWVEEWDKERGWDKVLPAHTLVHALEEMGEVARLVLAWEGYKPGEGREQVRAELAEELSDLFVFLFKLAYQVGIDLEEALKTGQVKAMKRFPDLEEAREAGESYRRHLREQVRQIGAGEAD